MNKNIWQIDFIKSISIVSVIILHTLPYNYLVDIYAQFHIWQAMPIFIFLIGYNFSYSYNKSYNYLSFIKKRLKRILIPLIVFNLMCFVFLKVEVSPYLFLFIPFTHYGTYFIGMLLILIIIFPFIFRFILNIKSLFKDINLQILILFFIFAVNEIYLCRENNFFYSLLPIRYFFDLVLGILFYLYRDLIFKNIFFWVLFVINLIWLLKYKFLILFFDILPNIWLKGWKFQHLFYFYTAFIVNLFFKLPNNLYNIVKYLLVIGKASFHIFLVQAIFFYFFKNKIFTNCDILFCKLFISLSICIGVGVLWFKLENYLVYRIIK